MPRYIACRRLYSFWLLKTILLFRCEFCSLFISEGPFVIAVLANFIFSLNCSEVHESNCTDLVLFLFQGKDSRQPFSSSISRRQSAAWEPRFLPSEQQRVQLAVPVGQHTRQNWLVLCSLTPLRSY